MDTRRSFRLQRRMRLSLDHDFQRVFEARMRRHAGPLLVYARPNDLTHSRLGLSVSRRVGPAVRRNRVKRLVREAFRLDQHDLPPGYDVVVVVQPHEPMSLEAYQNALTDAVEELDRRWNRRQSQDRTAQPLRDTASESPPES